MRSLSTVSLAEMLPPNLLSDPFIAALIPVFDAEFRLLVNDTAKILIFAGLATQPNAVLDQLAWQFNIDFYDEGASRLEKLGMIASAIYWHSLKGTPRAVEAVIGLALGAGIFGDLDGGSADQGLVVFDYDGGGASSFGGDATVVDGGGARPLFTLEEWFEYGGTPFHFRVWTAGGKFRSLARYTDFVRKLRTVKRTSAILEALQIEQTGQQTLTIGGVMQVGQHIRLGSA